MDWKKGLDKLRALPERNKKIIMFSVVGVVGLALSTLWIIGLEKSLPKTLHAITNPGNFPAPSFNLTLPNLTLTTTPTVGATTPSQ